MARGFRISIARLRQQLLDCLPQGWRNRIGAKSTPYLLRVDPGGDSATLVRDGHRLHEVKRDTLPLDSTLSTLLKPHRYPLVLELPAEWVLERELVLPAAAMENLQQVIGFELDRITPFQADQVYFDQEPVAGASSEGGQLRIRVVLVPRNRVLPWLEALQKAGLPIDRMVPPQAPPSLNLLPRELRAGPDVGRLALAVAPAAGLVLLLVAVLAVPLWQARETVVDLQQEESRLRRQAGGVIKLREALARKMEELGKIREYWKSVPPPLEVLQVLTQLLPDDTYLQQLDIRGDKLTIRGLSGQASALIGLLEASPVFVDPHFLSPVTQQRGKELFHLGATIRPRFPYEEPNAIGKENAKQEEQAEQD